jgi:hypothetical protein
MSNGKQKGGNPAKVNKSRIVDSTNELTKRTDTQEKTQEPRTPHPQSREENAWRSALHKRVSAWWLYASMLINLIMLIKDFSPDVSISASYALNASDPLSATFAIKNTGYVDIYNAIFECTAYEDQTELFKISDLGTQIGSGAPVAGLARAPKIESGHTATRDCVASQASGLLRITVHNPAAIRVDFSTSFLWPLLAVYAHEDRTLQRTVLHKRKSTRANTRCGTALKSTRLV